ncbi:MAG: hypothetical protein K2F91_03195, partial [Muribaculaceae bacterium]|nr:hypothetical protein [Muribaculaceae bacterium]
NAMVRCGMSNMLFYDRAIANVKAGETFNRVEGTFKFYFGQPEITNIIGGLDITGSAEAPSAMPAGVTEVQRNMLYSYMSLTDVAVTNINGKEAVITDELGNSCKLYNQFNAVSLAQGGGYNITGFVGVYKDDVQFWATDIDDTNSYELIDAPTFSLPSGSTVALYSRLDISAPEGATIYISVDGGEFEAGNMLYFYNMGEVEVRAYALLDGKRSPITTATYTVGKADRGMAWINDDYEPVAEVTVVFGSEEKPVYPFLDGIYDMPVFTSSNPEVATITEEGEITIVGLGSTTISATMDENVMYAAGEASFVINVISEEEAKAIKTTVDFSAQSWENGYGKDKTVTWTGSNGYTFETSSIVGANKSTYPALRTGDGVLRVYGSNGNEITVNAPANFQIKAFTVEYAQQDPIIKVGDKTITADGDEIAARAIAINKSKTYTLESAIDKFVITTGPKDNNDTSKTGQLDMGKIHFVLAEVPTGLNAVEVAGDTEAVYYNLQGVRVANPAAGIYIRIADGKASKVVIR